MTTETAARPGKLADYTLVRFLGEGNEGRVFTAKPAPRLRVSRDLVALKIMRDRTEPERFRAAARELQCVRCVQSPSIVTLHETGRAQDGTMYCAMEYACEGSLGGPVRNLSRGDILRAVERAARGAHALHEAGIIHGAIRPSNVLLATGRAKLAEPDLSHLLRPGRAFHALLPASLVQYMDPAFIRGDHASRASDIWALGVTLHVALTGKPIYYHAGPDLIHALRTVLTSSPIIDWSLTPEEADLVRACLTAEPSGRPATALEVAERIEQILRLENTVANQPPEPVMEAEAEVATGGPAGFEMTALWTADLPTPRDVVAHARERPGTAPMVEGILCKRGHLNYPLASYCVSCGISLLQAPRRLVRRQSPMLGVLILDDGSICNLDSDYVIGREPSRDIKVQEGLARPLRLDDQKHRVSGVHADIHRDGWTVLLTDRGSANGTFVRRSGSEEWVRLETGKPVELRSRTVVRIGERAFFFSSNRER